MRVDMVPGGTYDLVSNEEMHGHIAGIQAKMSEFIRQEVHGLKPIRFSSNNVVATAAAFNIAINSTPRSGYCWAVTRVVVAGDGGLNNLNLFRTADLTNVLMISGTNSVSSNALQFFVSLLNVGIASTFAKGQLLLNAGEFLVASSPDVTEAGKNYRLLGDAIEVPAEMIGKLLL